MNSNMVKQKMRPVIGTHFLLAALLIEIVVVAARATCSAEFPFFGSSN